MRRIVGLLVMAVTVSCGRSVPSARPYSYPTTTTVEVADTYFGKTYKDPYRWLENLKDKNVETWFKSQAGLTDDLLAKIPTRDALAQEWMQLDKLQPARYSSITFEHGRVFYKKTLGGENVGKLYFREGWKGAENLLFDPAQFKPVGSQADVVTTIEGIVPSPDGRYVALGFSSGGAEYSDIRVLEVDSRKLLSESMYPSYGP